VQVEGDHVPQLLFEAGIGQRPARPLWPALRWLASAARWGGAHVPARQ